MCVSPIRIRHPTSGEFVDVPCNKCIECLERKRNDWSLRLQQELLDTKSGYSYFVTLTYDDMHIPLACDEDTGCVLGYTLDKSAFHKWIRSLRDYLRYNFKLRNLRYFCCGEYGHNTLRPHYHMMFFGLPFDYDQFINILTHKWTNGFVQLGMLHDGGCHYQAKYMIKPSGLPPECELPFMSCSKGIGKGYLTKQMVDYHRKSKDLSRRQRQYSVSLPRYYRELIWSHEERILMKEEIISKYRDYLNKLMDGFQSDRNYFENRDTLLSKKRQKLFKSLTNKKL